MTEQSTPKMTHDEMIDVLKGLVFGTFDRTTAKEREALDMAITSLSEELSEDGTLTVHVADGSKVNRVLVMGENIFGGLYYPDSAENKGKFEGMTNGEVIQAIFPNASIYKHGSTYSVNNEYNFNSTWWNLPYKAESEEV